MRARELFLVFTNAVAGRDDEFNRWYDEIHVPDILDLSGVVSAQRYSLQPSERPKMAPNPTAHRYLTIYEVERDGNLVLQDMIAKSLSGTMALSEAFDITTASMDAWLPQGGNRSR